METPPLTGQGRGGTLVPMSKLSSLLRDSGSLLKPTPETPRQNHNIKPIDSPTLPGTQSPHHSSSFASLSQSYANPKSDLHPMTGFEDQYVPDLDYDRVVNEWNEPMGPKPVPRGRAPRSVSGKVLLPSSAEGTLYLDLNKLHSLVKPQPINLGLSFNRYLYSKLNEVMKLRTPLNRGEVGSSTAIDIKRRRPLMVEGNASDVNYEAILNSLPANFNDLPYSQRKKLVTLFSDLVDYLQFSLFAKNYLNENSGLMGLLARVGLLGGLNSSFTRRSRAGSVNTIAGRLLQQLATDLKKMQSQSTEKFDIDERGAIVMGHELGKVIGYGAWGTIRECVGEDGIVRAIKIVKLVRNEPDKDGDVRQHNPKVLEVFRHEIEIWRELHHENILPLLQSKETDTAIFCITNRIWGGTLFDVMGEWGEFDKGCYLTTGDICFTVEGQRHRLRQAIGYLRQIVEALRYMHGKGIVHGDLKLENVLVDGNDPSRLKVILCDFGMARKFADVKRRPLVRLKAPSYHTHLAPSGRGDADEVEDDDEGTLYIRSRLSQPSSRKPFPGNDATPVFTDDLQIGIMHGPALQLVDLNPVALAPRRDSFTRIGDDGDTKAPPDTHDLPHTHIGSLPYAAPELLSPAPPPLGPLADIWALGVITYSLFVGKLPFIHQNEEKLRSLITAGQYDSLLLAKACLLEWIYSSSDTSDSSTSGEDQPDRFSLPRQLFHSNLTASMVREQQMREIRESWSEYVSLKRGEFNFAKNMVMGCLELNITKRWDLDAFNNALAG